MRKNLILLFVLLSLSLFAFTLPAFAAINQESCIINAVGYDPTFNSYDVQLVNEAGEGFIYSLFQAPIKNNNLELILRKYLLNKKAIVYFDDMNTKSIYDDQILSFTLLN